MHDDHRQIAENWLRAAMNDRDAAELLAARLPPTACFHCQQAVKKAFKAVLVYLGGDAPRSHLIEVLLKELSEIGENVPLEIARIGRLFEKYYLPIRYPDALDGVDVTFAFSEKEAQSAIGTVGEIIAWARTYFPSFNRLSPD